MPIGIGKAHVNKNKPLFSLKDSYMYMQWVLTDRLSGKLAGWQADEKVLFLKFLKFTSGQSE